LYSNLLVQKKRDLICLRTIAHSFVCTHLFYIDNCIAHSAHIAYIIMLCTPHCTNDYVVHTRVAHMTVWHIHCKQRRCVISYEFWSLIVKRSSTMYCHGQKDSDIFFRWLFENFQSVIYHLSMWRAIMTAVKVI